MRVLPGAALMLQTRVESATESIVHRVEVTGFLALYTGVLTHFTRPLLSQVVCPSLPGSVPVL